jgi:myo-inositol-1(or 4)-monophosphatase
VQERAASVTAQPWRRELAVAVEAAHAAGRLLRDGFGRAVPQRRKGAHDVVTALDGAAEREIMGRLSSAFPADRRMGEESGLTIPRRKAAADPRRTWIVDPLDGTVNFAAGIPFWCVSIALAEEATVVIGVIHDPLRGETVTAVRERGARPWPDGDLLAVRRLRRTADAVLCADPGAIGDDRAEARIATLRPRVRAVRTLGSTALSLTALAQGRLDGVLQVRGLGAVDVAAAGLIAAEAGARVTDAEGGPWIVVDEPERGTGIAAAGPALHRRLIAPRQASVRQVPGGSSK